ncbi:MAG: TetR/AcrR family transcriptional regulator [Beijerinckiaceae bacterium]
MAKAKPRLELRDAMLAIAEAIIEKDGLAAVQARRIAQEAECSVGTIYNVFGNIDELVLLANARTLQHLGEQLQAAQQMAASQSLEVRILALALTYLEFASKHRKRWKAVFEHVMTDSDSVPQWYRDRQAPLFSTLAESLPASMSMAERITASQMLFSAAHGIVMLALDRKLTDAFDPATTEKQLRMLVRFAALGFENKS